ncbi:MAG: LytR C-terminal domain-containing protein [bacterium]|nr:MAG: LytR C-terminal domain-containing protein [bacterium]
MCRKRPLIPIFSAVLFWVLTGPVRADYLFPGYNESGELQPLATVISATPDQLFRTWKVGGLDAGRWSLGAAGELFNRVGEEANEDLILSITGAYGFSDRFLLGTTVPFIIRDREFNDSDLLDVKVFARFRMSGEKDRGFRSAGEVLLNLPTAGGRRHHLLSLETRVLGFKWAFSAGSVPLVWGANVGYQTYLQSVVGNDSDWLYGAYIEYELAARWTGVLELAGSTHVHKAAGDEERVSDDHVVAGVKYRPAGGPIWGAALGKGVGDSYTDARIVGTISWTFGERSAEKPARPAPQPGSVGERALPGGSAGEGVTKGPVERGPGPGRTARIEVANRSGVREATGKVVRRLEEEGFAVTVDDRDLYQRQSTHIYYADGFLEQASDVASILGGVGTVLMRPFSAGQSDILVVIGRDLSTWGP